MKKPIYILLFLIIYPFVCYCQNSNSKNDIIESIIEEIAAENENDLDYTNLLEQLQYLSDHPISLNETNQKELEQLPFLSDYQIQKFLEYKNKNEQILSYFELQLISGFSKEIIQKLIPFTTIQFSKPKDKSSLYWKNKLLIRMDRLQEKENAYSIDDKNKRYLGNPWKYYTRYEIKSTQDLFSGGFTAEKDRGEPFFESKNKEGFDFYSFHFRMKRKKYELNLGDYQIKFGQGVSLWSGFSSKKSSNLTNKMYRSDIIKSYKSTDENNFFRGIAGKIKLTNYMNIALFYSHKKRDGNLNSDTTSTIVSSIQNTGYHRNIKEFDDKNKLKEIVFGGVLSYQFSKIKTELLYLNYRYSPALFPQQKTYNYFLFSGKRNYNLAFTYKTYLKNISLWGEIAQSKSKGIGLMQGINLQIHSQLEFECIFRKYDNDYQAHFSNAFGENSKNQNEEGIYIGIIFYPFRNWTLKTYYDSFQISWLSKSCNSPQAGNEYFAQLNFTPNTQISCYFRFKQKVKFENNQEDPIKIPVKTRKRQYRFHNSYSINEQWEIRNRVEFSQYKKESKYHKGFLIYQDIIYHFQHIPFNINCRYAIFDTDSYDTRIYAYENDILYAFSTPAYYNKGIRFYINFNYEINKNCKLYLRLSQTKFHDTETIGSGINEIKGNKKSEIKILAKINF